MSKTVFDATSDNSPHHRLGPPGLRTENSAATEPTSALRAAKDATRLKNMIFRSVVVEWTRKTAVSWLDRLGRVREGSEDSREPENRSSERSRDVT